MYIGNDLQVAESGNKIIDDISSSFNGSTTSFALTVGGYAPVPFPINTQQIYISVNGVLQEPDPSGSAGFKLSGSNIVFSSAPSSGQAFFGVILSGADYVTVGTEFPAGSATSPSITFGTDNDTGLYSVTSGQMGFTSNGTQTFTLDGDAFRFNDNKKLVCGTGSDLQVYHDGTDSFIDNATGGLKILGDTIRLKGKTADETLLKAIVNGDVELYYNNTERFATTNTGTNTVGVHVDDGATHDGDVTFTGAAANIVWDKSDNALEFTDNSKAAFGSSSDLTITHDGSHSYIEESGTGDLKIRSNGNGVVLGKTDGENTARFLTDGAVELYYDNGLKFLTTSAGARIQGGEGSEATLEIYADEGDDNADKWRIRAETSGNLNIQNYASGSWETGLTLLGNGAVELRHDNTKKFETTADGVTLTGRLSPAADDSYGLGQASLRWANLFMSGDIDMKDSDKLLMGANDDLQLYHNGTSYIDASNGHLYIRNNVASDAGGDIFIEAKSGETSIKCQHDGFVKLYYDNSNRFETTSAGGTLSGQLKVIKSGYEVLHLENDDDTSNGPYIEFLTNSASPADGDYCGIISFRETNSNAENITYAQIRGQAGDITDGTEDGHLTFHTRNNGTFEEKLKITAGGLLKVPDNGKSVYGTGDDLQIYHNGTHSFLENQTGSLYLRGFTAGEGVHIQGRSGEASIVATYDGSVELYYDGSKKLETTSIGATITGSSHTLYLKRDGTATQQTGIKFYDGGDAEAELISWSSNLKLKTGGEDAIMCNDGGSVELYYNDSKKFYTNSDGVTIFGAESGEARLYFYADEGDDNADVAHFAHDTSGRLRFRRWDGSNWNSKWMWNPDDLKAVDDVKLILGSGDDLEIYHNGTNSLIENGTGELLIRAKTGENSINCNPDGSVELYYNNVKKFETKSDGNFSDGKVYIGAYLNQNGISSSSDGSSSATLYIGNQSISTSSDQRLKTDIVNTALNATTKLKQVRVVDFKWNDPSDKAINNRNSRGVWTGTLAQEIVNIFPHAVNAPRPEGTDIDTSSSDIWGMEYQHLVPVLIKGFQEQQAEIETLKTKVAALEAK